MLKLDTNIKPIYVTSVEEFNEYVNKYDKNVENRIVLTNRNNISQDSLRILPCSLTWKRANHFEYQYIDSKTQIRVLYAIRFEEKDKDNTKIAYDALNYFKGILDVIPDDDHEKDVNMFTCPENYFSQYYNYVNERYIGLNIEHTYSLDRNSAFLASMLQVYPQTKPWVDKYYADKLAGKTEIKQFDKILIGWLRNASKHREHAWKKIINNSNRAIHNLRKKIEENGNEVLLVNTDAIKYIGKFEYNTSKDLGGFKYEWEDTSMYIKGVKSYAYFDKNENKWKFKQAGECKLDLVKPRSEWTLEDFKNSTTLSVKHVKKLPDSNLLGEFYE